jgi:hypothetical protein
MSPNAHRFGRTRDVRANVKGWLSASDRINDSSENDNRDILLPLPKPTETKFLLV